MITWGFWILIISLVSTSKTHGVVVLHLPVLLVGMVAVEWLRICTSLKVFKWVTFLTVPIGLMTILAPWCKKYLYSHSSVTSRMM